MCSACSTSSLDRGGEPHGPPAADGPASTRSRRSSSCSARVEADPGADDFYSRLCEATCRLADMDRAVIFRYDGARRRVRAAGAYGIDLETFDRTRR